MQTLQILPTGWPCTLAECPPGLFVFNSSVGFKSEYGIDDPYCESGEIFWGGVSTKEERSKLIVQPCVATWITEDSL